MFQSTTLLSGLVRNSYPSVPLDRYDGPFFLQLVNVIKVTKTSRQQWNRILDAVVTIIKYKEIIIYHSIYIKVFSYVTLPYLAVSTNDVINTNNNETEFPKLRRVFEE